jgi:indole-3-glycerol phosphate synthase
MAGTYLDEILVAHRTRASLDVRDWRQRVDTVRATGPSLLEALRAPSDFVKVIAEVKRRSPSKGWIDEHLDAAELARQYELGGASAISVLTDERFFAGSVADLAAVRSSVGLPILRKDFTVCANDVLDAAEMGASAVLLIVAALDDAELETLMALADRLGLDALVEVHDEAEAARAEAAGARLIGVNQRDLRTFEVDPERAQRVAAGLPADVVKVAESGLSDVAGVVRAASAGFDAVLVGECFVRARDPRAAVRDFALVRRGNGD